MRRMIIVALLCALSYAQTVGCPVSEAKSCTANSCERYPAAKEFCPCACPSVTTPSLTTPPPTPLPTQHCIESPKCAPDTCSLHGGESAWFCPCTCRIVYPSGDGDGSSTSSSSFSSSSSSSTGTSSSTTTTTTTSAGSSSVNDSTSSSSSIPSSSTGTSSSSTSASGTTSSTAETSTSGSSSESSSGTSDSNINPNSGSSFSVWPYSNGPNTNSGTYSNTDFSSNSGSNANSGSASANSMLITQLQMNCELLPRSHCFGLTANIGRFCMWHVRDLRCHEGLLNSPDDICGQFDDQVACNFHAGPGMGAPAQGCCWDSEGYCDTFDGADCGLPTGPAGAMMANGMATNMGAGGSQFRNFPFTNLNGEMEFEHPEMERNEFEHPEFESGGFQGGYQSGGAYQDIFGAVTNGGYEQFIQPSQLQEIQNKAAEESTFIEPIQLQKTQNAAIVQKKFLLLASLGGLILGFVMVIGIQKTFRKAHSTMHTAPLTHV